MSFVEPEGIFSLIEAMLCHCWPNHLPEINIPFPKMSYAEAMRNYGVDKPDTRFEIKVSFFFCLRMKMTPYFVLHIIISFSNFQASCLKRHFYVVGARCSELCHRSCAYFQE